MASVTSLLLSYWRCVLVAMILVVLSVGLLAAGRPGGPISTGEPPALTKSSLTSLAP